MWRELQPGDPELTGPGRLRGLLGVGGGMGRVYQGVSRGQCLKDWRLAWISGGGCVCG